ncbi:MAG: hypothetical protein HRT90_11845 [Candidatus Margulisbacteria bacterium]|nr:hypothetical protein [Candidatus Margulisiibacteriota bacterium]
MPSVSMNQTNGETNHKRNRSWPGLCCGNKSVDVVIEPQSRIPNPEIPVLRTLRDEDFDAPITSQRVTNARSSPKQTFATPLKGNVPTTPLDLELGLCAIQEVSHEGSPLSNTLQSRSYR